MLVIIEKVLPPLSPRPGIYTDILPCLRGFWQSERSPKWLRSELFLGLPVRR